MHKVVVKRDLDLPADRTWEILDDFGAVHRYHPLVDRSPIQNGIDSGLGAERVCHFDDGNSIKERITDYEEGRAYTVKIVDTGRFPLRSAVARLSVEPLERDRSRVGFEMSFEPKYGPLGWLMGATVMQSQLRKTLSDVLAGLEAHALTGGVVSRKPGITAAAA